MCRVQAEETSRRSQFIAFSVGYNRPVSDRITIGVGAMYASDMVEDDERTLTLRLDSLWAAGVGLEWQWKPTRAVVATLSYLQLGDAPVTSASIPLIGSVTGEYTDRGTIWLQLGLSFGTGPKSQ